jgi:hypothetical protein
VFRSRDVVGSGRLVTEEPTIETFGSGNCSCDYAVANKGHYTWAIQAWLGRPCCAEAGPFGHISNAT